MKKLLLCCCAALFAANASAQPAYEPSPENLAARQRFADGRFGIFLHWGLYALLGQGEWVMTNQDIDYHEYEKLAGAFCPAAFDAKAWVTAFREAGARYVCFTTRHHDGFSMFRTAQSPYNVADATPAAFYGHSVERDNADELTRCLMDGRVDLLCGSGIREFTRRSDGVDLIGELEKQYDFVRSVDEIKARKGKVICIDETMDDAAEQANLTLLADATRASIAKLQEQGGKGFFLMVEGAKIDYAGHSRCLPGSIIEMLSFDLAVAEALKFADRNGETLVVVTADHETGGLVLVDGDERTGRVMGVYVSDDHTPAMLPVFAYGPGADKFCGTYMNTEIARRIKSLIK